MKRNEIHDYIQVKILDINQFQNDFMCFIVIYKKHY